MENQEALHTAMLWSPGEGGSVACSLCAHRCEIGEGKYGICRVRRNVGGELKTLTYDRVTTMNVDPIEKKPLFHFLPGTTSLSIATPGCNFKCDFCQNWRLSQSPRNGDAIEGCPVSPEEIVEEAVADGCRSISYTYSEPTIFFELAFDTATIAAEKGLKNCFISNGYMTPEAVKKISPLLDSINVDLKCFSEKTYRDVMGGTLKGVLEGIRALVREGIWVEITTLVVPGMNDSPGELREVADFISSEAGSHVPWHVSGFHGDYKKPDGFPTPMETLERAVEIGHEAGLEYVYCGNAHGNANERTLCSNCGELLVDRRGFSLMEINIAGGCCPGCGNVIRGVWE